MGVKSLAISLFGGLQVSLDGQPAVGFESSRVRALLVYLVVEPNQPHSRQQLAGFLWPEQDESIAHQRLSQALYNLRQTIGEAGSTGVLSGSNDRYLLVTPQDVQFNPHASYWLDVHIFTELLQSCASHSHSRLESCPECTQRMAEAVSIYKGEFLAGFSIHNTVSFDEWSSIWRERLHLQAIAALNHLVQFHISRGEVKQALEYARQRVALDPLDDAGHRQLMRLLALNGDQTAAMLVYTNFQRRLKQELGVIPERETSTLFERLHMEAESGVALGNLPEMLSPLVGRRNSMAELTALLLDPTCRLISVLGPGGSGKTRLALEVGHDLRYQFAHGVYWVSLSALTSAEALTSSLAEVLGLVFRGVLPRKTQLQDYLRSKQLLLILDSFETILEAGKQVVDLLQSAPHVSALVTTRARLNVADEQVYPLGGMDYLETTDPDQAVQSSAVQLFMLGARRSRPDFILDAANAAPIGRICRLVSGMPLGLLLASTWVSDYTVDEIANQISHSLDFLSVEWADLPERQRSLRATFEYSWNLLSTHEQQLLMNLAVFCSAFTRQAALQVAAARDHELHALAGKSLLESAPDGGFRMHDLVHQFSVEKLKHAPGTQEYDTRLQHSNFFLGRVAGWSTEFKGAQQSFTLAEADKEIENAQAAWEWTAEQGDMDRLSQALEGLLMYYNLRYRYPEGEHACQLVLNALASTVVTSESLTLEGWLHAWQAGFYRLLGKVDLARQSANSSQEKLNQAEAAGQDIRREQALLWQERGGFESSLPEQLHCLQRSAALFQALGDPWRQARLLSPIGEITNRMGDHRLGLELHQQALTLSQAAGEPSQIAGALISLAYDHWFYRSLETAARLMEEGTVWFRSRSDLGSQAHGERHFSLSLAWRGRFAEACEMMELALAKEQQIGNRFEIADGTVILGIFQMHAGWYKQAAINLQAGLDATRLDGFQRDEAFDLAQLGCLALLQAEPSKAIVLLLQSVSNYRQMGFAGELGMALGGLALAQHTLGLEEQSWASLQEALYIASWTHNRSTLATLPVALIVLLADGCRWEQAVEAYTALIADPIVANSRWFADMIGNRIDLARGHLPEDVRLAAEARGRVGDVFEVLGRLAQEIGSWGMALCG